jgi:diguanylate cyclase (GGDEF)-like protein
MKSFWNSLQFRIPLAFVASFGLILLAVSAVVSTLGKTSLEEQAFREAALTGRIIVAELSDRIASAEAIARALANLGEQLPPDESLHKELAVRLLDYKGTEQFIAGGGLWPAPYRFDPKVERRSFFWGRDKRGHLQYYDDYNDPAGPGYHHEEWYVPATYLKDDQSFWSKSYMDPYSYQPMVTVTVPMYRDGAFYGVSTVDLKLEGLHDFLKQATAAFGGYAFAVDRNGKFLSFPNEDLVKLVNVDRLGMPTQDFKQAAELAGEMPAFTPLAEALQAAIDRTVESARNNDRFDPGLAGRIAQQSYQISPEEARLIAAVLATTTETRSGGAVAPQRIRLRHDMLLGEPAYATVFNMPGTSWKIVTVIPYSEAAAPYEAIYTNLVIAIMLVMLVAFLIVLAMVRGTLVKPIAEMSQQLQLLGDERQENYRELQVSQSTELGELADRFNQRTRKLDATQKELKAAHDELEQRVAERTRELQLEIRKGEENRRHEAERSARIEKQYSALIQLSLHEALTERSLVTAYRLITQISAEVIDVARSSIWLIDESREELVAVDLYEQDSGRHTSGMVLQIADYPTYFKSLGQERSIAVPDMFSDPRTVEFHTYAEHNNLVSLLDAPIRIGGILRGVVCFEHSGKPRHWLEEEIRFSGEIADQVIQVLASAERLESEEKIRQLAFYDPLTDLANRRLLLETLEHELAVARRAKRYGGIIYLDLDNFKTLNDSLGHAVGDELLAQLSERLKTSLREEDIAARLGGDEFVVLLIAQHRNRSEAMSQALEVSHKLQNIITTAYRLKGYEHIITASMGVTIYPEKGDTASDILKQADTAMYRAKDEGRNRICFYSLEMQDAADHRLVLEKELRSAVLNNDFEMYFQSQVDVEGKPIGAEALVRWNHRDRGVVSPAEFIPVAEETGLILDLGAWILRDACQFISETQLDYVGINISPQQFRQPKFVKHARSVIQETGASPERIVFEVTENVVINNIEDTIAKMTALKDMGLKIAIDDFGTGYSSLAYLKRLPLDQLKISNDFVRDITTDPNDAIIVDTILSMARHLGLKVVAEGVETEAQLQFLKDRGCAVYQGFFFSRPQPRGTFGKLKTERGHLSGVAGKVGR